VRHQRRFNLFNIKPRGAQLRSHLVHLGSLIFQRLAQAPLTFRPQLIGVKAVFGGRRFIEAPQLALCQGIL
jgi:hypothetical protein